MILNFNGFGVTVGLARCVLLSGNFGGEWLLNRVWLPASFVLDCRTGVIDPDTGYVVGSVTG